MNAEDPLSQLRDIHLPEPGGFWPPAPGWWILAALVIALIAALVWWLWRRYQRNAWIRDARRELQQLSADARADAEWFARLNALLKRCARQRYPDQQPHTLSGQQWGAFLTRTQPSLDQEQVDALVTAAWTPTPRIETAAACRLAEHWLGGQRC